MIWKLSLASIFVLAMNAFAFEAMPEPPPIAGWTWSPGDFVLRDPSGTLALSPGQGYDTLAASPKGHCFSKSSRIPVEGKGKDAGEPQRGSFDFDDTESTSKLREQIGSRMKLSGQTGIINASAEMESKTTEEHSSIARRAILKSVVELEAEALDTSKLKFDRGPIEVVHNGTVRAFRSMCGDYYVRAVVRGGEFSAVYSFTSFSKAHTEDFRAAFKIAATYLTASGSGAAEFTQAAQFLATQRDTKFRAAWAGPALKIGTLDVKSLLDYAKDFPSKVTNKNAWAYYAVLSPYSTAPNAAPPNETPRFQKFLASVNAFKEVIDQYSAALDVIDEQINLIKYVQTHTFQFEKYSGSYDPQLKKLEELKTTVQESAKACATASLANYDSRCRVPVARPPLISPQPRFWHEFSTKPATIMRTENGKLETTCRGPIPANNRVRVEVSGQWYMNRTGAPRLWNDTTSPMVIYLRLHVSPFVYPVDDSQLIFAGTKHSFAGKAPSENFVETSAPGDFDVCGYVDARNPYFLSDQDPQGSDEPQIKVLRPEGS